MATETELAIKKLQDEVIDLRKRLESMLSRRGGYVDGNVRMTGDLAYDGDLQPQRSAVSYEGCIPVPLTVPLTSTDWDGDSYSTTAKTLIDLSAVFGVPAGVKAVYVRTTLNDSGSAATECAIILGPTDTSGQGLVADCSGRPNDIPAYDTLLVPCNANGDIYYQIIASGAGTLNAWIQVWGYWL